MHHGANPQRHDTHHHALLACRGRRCDWPEQDFDPARAHSKRLVNVLGNQLRSVHEQLSAVDTDIMQDCDAKSRRRNHFPGGFREIRSIFFYVMPSD